MDDSDFLADLEAANEGNIEEPKDEPKAEPEATPEEPKVEEPKGERTRDEHGRFVPKAPEAQPEPQPAPQPEAVAQPPKEEPIMVPLAALQETRDKLRALEARLTPPAPQPQPVEIPDPDRDPQGFAEYQTRQFEGRQYQDRLFFSERLARMQHGDDTFSQAQEWGVRKCDEDPHFNARVRSSQDPYAVVMAEYQREEIASKVTPDQLKQFLAWQAAQNQLAQPQPSSALTPAPPNPAPSIPPPSLASAPSAGSVLHEPALTETEMFEEAFPKRN